MLNTLAKMLMNEQQCEALAKILKDHALERSDVKCIPAPPFAGLIRREDKRAILVVGPDNLRVKIIRDGTYSTV